MYHCYILYSAALDRYYIGKTGDLTNRIKMHNAGFSSYTSKASDWHLYLKIPCPNEVVASKVERHIKSMKSRKYIEDLLRYPEMIEKLVARFCNG